jgi:hypothetical protein
MDSLIAASAAAVQLFICTRPYLYLLLAIRVQFSIQRKIHGNIYSHIRSIYVPRDSYPWGARNKHFSSPYVRGYRWGGEKHCKTLTLSRIEHNEKVLTTT